MAIFMLVREVVKGRYSMKAVSTKILMHVVVSSHLHYCNSLLSRISRYQINTARLPCLVPKVYLITLFLIDLHWSL